MNIHKFKRYHYLMGLAHGIFAGAVLIVFLFLCLSQSVVADRLGNQTWIDGIPLRSR